MSVHAPLPAAYRPLPTRHFWLWPAIVGLSGVAVGLAQVLDVSGPVRVAIAFWFLLACPGLPWVKLLRLHNRLIEWPLIVALSLSLDTAVTTTFVYTDLWTAQICLLVLIVVSYVGAVLLLDQGQRSA